MKNRIIEIFKGFLIGMINVIPGFSTSTMAIVLGVYDKCIRAFSILLKRPKETFKEVWALFLGLLIGIGSSVYLIATLLQKYPIVITMFFVGLIIGSIPKQFLKIKGKRAKPEYISGLILSFAILVAIPLINTTQISFDDFEFNIVQALILFLVGAIGAAFLVMGASGTIILMALGYYEITVVLAKNIIEYSIIGEGIKALEMFCQILPFMIGTLIGASIFSSIMKRLIDNDHMSINYIVLGLVTAAPIVVIYKLIESEENIFDKSQIINWIIGLFTLLIGIIITVILGRYDEKKKKRQFDNQVA